MIPYSKHKLSADDIDAVVKVLEGDWLTTGPHVSKFESFFADFVGTHDAVAVSNGTAALHAAMYALGIGPGDEVVVPAITFAATSNSVLYLQGLPVFADVDPQTLLISPEQVEKKITKRTKAITAVDYAGQPCDYDALREIADRHGVALVDDACHSLGGRYKQRMAGSLADLNTFSFHPLKNITTGEGGMISTNNKAWAEKMRNFRNHGIPTDHWQRSKKKDFLYDMVDLGFNYRITDFQCALGINQMQKLDKFVARRQEIAQKYNKAFSDLHYIEPLRSLPDVSHAYHLYVVKMNLESLGMSRMDIFQKLTSRGIGCNVHYMPVYLHPYYRKNLGTRPGLCPEAEDAYERIISLPISPAMDENDVDTVIEEVSNLL